MKPRNVVSTDSDDDDADWEVVSVSDGGRAQRSSRRKRAKETVKSRENGRRHPRRTRYTTKGGTELEPSEVRCRRFRIKERDSDRSMREEIRDWVIGGRFDPWVGDLDIAYD